MSLKRVPRSPKLPEPNLQSSLPHNRRRSRSLTKTTTETKMRTCVLQCCLTLLGLSLVLCSNGVSSQPDLDLRHRGLLQRGQALGVAAQEWTKNDLKDILAQLTMPESEFQESDVSTLGTKQDLTVELERSAEDPNSLPPRERKAGCKNFYWKGFTSC